MKSLNGAKVAFMVANEGVEEIELTKPWEKIKQAGGQPFLIAPQEGETQAFNHLDKSKTFKVDYTTSNANPEDFDALVLPGGVANPDQLRTDPKAVAFAKSFMASSKPVAAICHGPWTLVETGELKGKTITSWPSLKTDIENAGGHWVDEQVHLDGNLVTSRKPDDLEAFSEALIEKLSA